MSINNNLKILDWYNYLFYYFYKDKVIFIEIISIYFLTNI